MQRTNISTGTPWEPIIGYSRAVRIGDAVHVPARRPPTDAGQVVGVGNPYQQTVQTLKNIASALERAGAQITDVVRTRIYVTSIADWGTDRPRAWRGLRPNSARNHDG